MAENNKRGLPPVWVWVLGIMIMAAVMTVFLSTNETPAPAPTPVVEAPVETPAPETEPASEAKSETPAEPEKPAEAPAAPVAEEKPAEPKPEIPPEQKILVRVEGKEITEQDLLNLVQAMGPQGRALYQNPEGRQALLNELVSQRLLVLEAEKAKLDESDEYKTALNAAMENIRTQFLTQLAAREILKDVAPVTPEEVRKYYDENINRFMQPEKLHASHILIADDEASVDVIAKVQNDLKNGVAFDALAREVSICPSKEQGGDLGEFQRGQMVPEFEEAAFALKEAGEISEPIKSQFGWHIIKLEGRIPATPIEFERVQNQLAQELQQQRTGETLNAKLAELRNVYNVEVLEPELEHQPDPKIE